MRHQPHLDCADYIAKECRCRWLPDQQLTDLQILFEEANVNKIWHAIQSIVEKISCHELTENFNLKDMLNSDPSELECLLFCERYCILEQNYWFLLIKWWVSFTWKHRGMHIIYISLRAMSIFSQKLLNNE